MARLEDIKLDLLLNDIPKEYDMDYEETFAHVEKMTIVCNLIVVAYIFQLKNFQIDVKNVFLNGDLHDSNTLSLLRGTPR